MHENTLYPFFEFETPIDTTTLDSSMHTILSSSFMYCGSESLNKNDGDIIIDKETHNIYCYCKGQKVLLSSTDNLLEPAPKTPKMFFNKIVKVTHCPCCGAPVKANTSSCDYCGVLYPTEIIS